MCPLLIVARKHVEFPHRPQAREDRTLPLGAADRTGIRRPDAWIEQPPWIGRSACLVRMPFRQPVAKRWIGEPDAAVGMRRQIVRRVQRLAVERIRDHRHRAVVLPAHHAAIEVLGGQLPALEIERIAVAVVRRLAERRHPPVVPKQSILRVAYDVAENQILALARPGRSFRPGEACREAMGSGITDAQSIEGRIDDDDVGVGIDVRRRVMSHSRAGLVMTESGVPIAAVGCCARATEPSAATPIVPAIP